MDLNDKTFSIVPKMRGLIFFGLALGVVCLVTTVRTVIDFENAFMRANLLAKFAAIVMVFTVFLIAALLLFSPFRYRLVKGGVRIESLMRATEVRFDQVAGAVVDIPARQRKSPVERVVLFVGTKAYFLVGLATNYETLRDQVLESLDPSIIDDRRIEAEGE